MTNLLCILVKGHHKESIIQRFCFVFVRMYVVHSFTQLGGLWFLNVFMPKKPHQRLLFTTPRKPLAGTRSRGPQAAIRNKICLPRPPRSARPYLFNHRLLLSSTGTAINCGPAPMGSSSVAVAMIPTRICETA